MEKMITKILPLFMIMYSLHHFAQERDTLILELKMDSLVNHSGDLYFWDEINKKGRIFWDEERENDISSSLLEEKNNTLRYVIYLDKSDMYSIIIECKFIFYEPVKISFKSESLPKLIQIDLIPHSHEELKRIFRKMRKNRNNSKNIGQ